MCNRRLIASAVEGLRETNDAQYAAVMERTSHCVVLAGPGSGKTRTLTLAMGRALAEDVTKPRGIACITYNNECALELEQRLATLGIAPSERVFIGTVHGFSLTHVISPYARIVAPEVGSVFRVASSDDRESAKKVAYDQTFGDFEDYRERWRFAEAKRLREVDRTAASWSQKNPELAQYIEAYESELRRRGLLDFDDMPLLAYRMLREHPWIRDALHARFPVLYVDEYQDLGHALHELVMLLCLNTHGTRLFAVGDADQSIYGFTGANPELLLALTRRTNVRTIQLRMNYRSGTKIIAASVAALGEDRDYVAAADSGEGYVNFIPVDANLASQAEFISQQLVPRIADAGVPYQEIAILYRNATEGNAIADAISKEGIPHVRADRQALIPRSNRFARLIEACATWVSGGWKTGEPSFERLSREALTLVFTGSRVSDEDALLLRFSLMQCLKQSTAYLGSAHQWLRHFRDTFVAQWKPRSQTALSDWDILDELISHTDTVSGEDISVALLGGQTNESGRITLSTLHSAKGREFDVVILFGINGDVLPSWRDKSPKNIKEARRLFYVGVTRPRKELHIVHSQSNPSIFIGELQSRISPSLGQNV